MNNKITQNKYKKLRPFKGWVLQNFPFIEEDFDALTNYEFMSKIGGYLKVIQENQVLLEDDMTNVIEAYQKLENYVNDYFKNLDVTQEINDKLDQMAMDGTLAEILANYLNLKRFVTTTEEMINETSTIKIRENYVIETYGYSIRNDGGASEFFITSVAPDNKFYFELQNGLFAIPIKNLENVLIYGVKNDGITDNSKLLSKIVEFTNKLFFPKGQYNFNLLSYNNVNNVEIYGEGTNSILKCINSNTSTYFPFILIENSEYSSIHDLKIDSSYIGQNFTVSFVNINNTILKDCYITGATSQRTVNIQNFNANYGYNNIIDHNYILRDSQTTVSGALIECTGELSGDMNQYLHNLQIKNNTCICNCDEYIGNIDLFDCIETDNCVDTIIENNYLETTMHIGISLDTRNINTKCSKNFIKGIGMLNHQGFNITGTPSIQNCIIDNNTIENFDQGIFVDCNNTQIINNTIINSSIRGINLGNYCNNNAVNSNYIQKTPQGIYVSSGAFRSYINNNVVTDATVNNDVVVDSGTGAGLRINHNNPTGISISSYDRLNTLNGVYVNRIPNYNNQIYSQTDGLYYKDLQGNSHKITN